MALLVPTAQAEDAHYYDKDGTPCHGTLREARKRGAYPSVSTTISSVIAKPGLDFYKQSQAIAAARTLPKKEDESESDFVQRVIEDSRAEVKAAADRGTYVHSLSECAAKREQPTELRAGFEPHWESLKYWSKFCYKVHKCEEVVVNHEEGYAGRVDLICDWGDAKEHGVEVVDFKTRKFKKVGRLIPDMPGHATHDEPHKVDSYDTDIIQLAAYAYAVFEEPVAARSVYIDPATGALENKLWTPEDVEEAFEIFKNVLAIWRWMKNYDPREVQV